MKRKKSKASKVVTATTKNIQKKKSYMKKVYKVKRSVIFSARGLNQNFLQQLGLLISIDPSDKITSTYCRTDQLWEFQGFSNKHGRKVSTSRSTNQ